MRLHRSVAVLTLSFVPLSASCSVAGDAASQAVARAVDTVQCRALDALVSQLPDVATLDQTGMNGLSDTAAAIDRFIDQLPAGTVSAEVAAAIDRAATESATAAEQYGQDPVVSEAAGATAAAALDEAIATLRVGLGC